MRYNGGSGKHASLGGARTALEVPSCTRHRDADEALQQTRRMAAEEQRKAKRKAKKRRIKDSEEEEVVVERAVEWGGGGGPQRTHTRRSSHTSLLGR